MSLDTNSLDPNTLDGKFYCMCVSAGEMRAITDLKWCISHPSG